jgi:hypothetical protein
MQNELQNFNLTDLVSPKHLRKVIEKSMQMLCNCILPIEN